jgi:predicted RNase H-like nuclease (RuvC/YqgF family)
MATEILVLLLAGDGILAGTLSSVVTWLLTRKKYNSEVENGNIQNMQESLEFYVKLADDYKARLTAEIDSHNAEVAELKRENAELKKEIREQEKKFDERLLAQQREITLMKNQMLSVYSQVCLNFKCLERTAATHIPTEVPNTIKKSKSNKGEDK